MPSRADFQAGLLAGALALALSACDASNDPEPGGVTADEARALDEAAEMLDARRPSDRSPPTADDTERDAVADGDG